MNMPRPMMDATIEALRKHAPYDRMDRDSLEYLVSNVSLAYHPKGSTVTSPAEGVARRLYILQRGQVRGTSELDGSDLEALEYANGDTFPLASIMGRRATRFVYKAVEDCFCYEADAGVVEALVQRSPVFHAFCTGRVNALLQQSYSLLQAQYAQRSSGQQQLSLSLRDLLRRPALHCRPGELLRDALRTMQQANVGSIVVADEALRPVGIFTERDLLRLAASSLFDPAQPIQSSMTPSPRCLPLSATAAEAAVLMAQLGIRHVVAVEDGRLAGVVSERDLFSLQRTSMRGIVQAVAHATGNEDLVRAAGDIRALATNLLAQGIAAGQLIQLIATLNDRLCARVLDLEAQHHDLSGIRLCWIALGSEGRLEQTFSTDQDNGIIFQADLDDSQVRHRLLPFARAVNATLDRCGFPLCKGEIMASNPQWCLSEKEWCGAFDGWNRNPLPQALLHSTIFYDFRGVWGDESLAQALRVWLAEQVQGNPRFLRAMAANALESRPPLGFFADFVTSGKGGERNTIDLKSEGARPFIDAARILALASGCTLTNTALRLRQAGDRARMPREEIEAMVESFHYIQLLRLRHQLQDDSNGANPNRIAPDVLNELDRRILKEALRQARKLQRRIALDYQL